MRNSRLTRAKVLSLWKDTAHLKESSGSLSVFKTLRRGMRTISRKSEALSKTTS
jgi:hypothetical protein